MKTILFTSLLICIITTAGEVFRTESSADFHSTEYSRNESVNKSPVDINAKTDIPELFLQNPAVAEKLATDSVYQDVNGFRIQVYKTSNITEAKKREAMYVDDFGEENVILIFEKPFYKIRIGRFKNKDEAVEYQKILSRKGINDTIIIPDVVRLLLPGK